MLGDHFIPKYVIYKLYSQVHYFVYLLYVFVNNRNILFIYDLITLHLFNFINLFYFLLIKTPGKMILFIVGLIRFESRLPLTGGVCRMVLGEELDVWLPGNVAFLLGLP